MDTQQVVELRLAMARATRFHKRDRTPATLAELVDAQTNYAAARRQLAEDEYQARLADIAALAGAQ